MAAQERETGYTHAVAAAVAGTVLEYYDFAVYGFLAVYISKAFFPTGNALTSLMIGAATFGVGFVMRPVGAIVLGGYADRAGRKAGLTMTIVLMALGTAIIACTPSFKSIGMIAPVLVVCGRLLQGFSAGGELGSATAFLIEHAAANGRGRLGSFQQVSQGAALLTGSLAGALVTSLLSDIQMVAWGWRLPFLFGLVILPVGLYLRSNVTESQDFLALREPTKRPIRDSLAFYPRKLAIGFGVTIAWTVCTYSLLIYMPTYAIRELGIAPAQALLANAAGMISVMLFAYLSGTTSDRTGRRGPMMLAALTLTASVYFAFDFITHNASVGNLVLVQIGLGMLVGIYTGPAPALIGEMFPVAVRSSGFSLAYNFAVTIFGGFAPFISTWLIASTGSKLAPTFYVMAATGISGLALACLKSVPPAPEAQGQKKASPIAL